MKDSVYSKILLFLILIIVFDTVTGVFLNKRFLEISSGTYGYINRALKSTSSIFILGSSRAMHHYNTTLIEKSLQKSCHNAGLGGYGIFLNYAILKERLNHSKPDLVILDISPNTFVKSETYIKLSLLLPYYSEFSAFKEIIHLNPDFTEVELISQLYKYNSTLYELVKRKKKHLKYLNGYEPLSGKVNQMNFTPLSYKNEIIDSAKILYLNKLVYTCKINKIKLIAFVSPTYHKYDTNNIIIDSFRCIFQKNSIDFYDFSNLSLSYAQPQFFKDQLHLNSDGAAIYTNFIITFLKEKT